MYDDRLRPYVGDNPPYDFECYYCERRLVWADQARDDVLTQHERKYSTCWDCYYQRHPEATEEL